MIVKVTAEVVISLRDGTEAVGRLYANVGGNTEIALARAAAQQLAGRAVAISGCALAGYSITWTTIISDAAAPPGPPAAGRAVLVFATDEADQYAVLAIPGVLPDLVDDGEIDPTQEPIADFVAALIAGPWINPFEANITALEASYYEFKP